MPDPVDRVNVFIFIPLSDPLPTEVILRLCFDKYYVHVWLKFEESVLNVFHAITLNVVDLDLVTSSD